MSNLNFKTNRIFIYTVYKNSHKNYAKNFSAQNLTSKLNSFALNGMLYKNEVDFIDNSNAQKC